MKKIVEFVIDLEKLKKAEEESKVESGEYQWKYTSDPKEKSKMTVRLVKVALLILLFASFSFGADVAAYIGINQTHDLGYESPAFAAKVVFSDERNLEPEFSITSLKTLRYKLVDEVNFDNAHKIETGDGYAFRNRLFFKFYAGRFYFGPGLNFGYYHTSQFDKGSIFPTLHFGYLLPVPITIYSNVYFRDQTTLNHGYGFSGGARFGYERFLLESEMTFMWFTTQPGLPAHGWSFTNMIGYQF